MPTRWRGQRGQSLPETALMIVVIFMVVFWVFELGWIMYTYSVLAAAANEGVRYAIVHTGGGATASPTTQTIVNDFAATSLHDVSAMTVAVTAPDGSYAPPNRVRVMVSYRYVPVLSTFMSTPTLHTYAEARMLVQ